MSTYLQTLFHNFFHTWKLNKYYLVFFTFSQVILNQESFIDKSLFGEISASSVIANEFNELKYVFLIRIIMWLIKNIDYLCHKKCHDCCQKKVLSEEIHEGEHHHVKNGQTKFMSIKQDRIEGVSRIWNISFIFKIWIFPPKIWLIWPV